MPIRIQYFVGMVGLNCFDLLRVNSSEFVDCAGLAHLVEVEVTSDSTSEEKVMFTG